ncbi:MAG TPA: fibronectin type III domain-containing protein, partial [Pilimelia sp.]|nr:fibronectin type III domain-containing protein [Pilimelia sp.]
RYVVQGAGRTLQVGADQRGVVVTGLTNGETYAFTVHAVNARGAGPKRTSNKVMPTAEVPDPPTSVSATAKPDGTVEVRWPAADGQGRSIARYSVSVVSEGVTATLGDATETTLTVPDGQLEYGRQYAFSVVAVNDRGAASKSSPVSDTVVPFTVPGAVGALSAGPVAEQRGAVRVQWQPAADHGRPVTGYVVTAAGAAREVADTSVVLTGLPDGKPVTVEVKAVNEAGEGPGQTAVAAPVAVPVVNVSTRSATTTAITVQASLSAGAQGATCVLSVGGKRSATVACGERMTVSGLYPGTSYDFTVTATNVAGRGTKAGTQVTTAMFGRAHCTTSSDSPEHRAWCRDPDNALELQRDPTRLHSQQVGRTEHGERYETVCRYDNGVEVYAYIYNNDRRSRIWIKIKAQGGEYYTPWAWFNLDGGAHPSVLRPC